MLPGLAGRKGLAVEHGDMCVRDVHHAGLVEQRRDAFQVAQGTAPGGQVIDGQHAVGLAAAKGRLQLDHRLAALAVEPLHHLDQQQAQPLRDEGALVEGGGILVLARGLAGLDGGDVGGKLRLLKGAFQDILMGCGYFAPGFHRFTAPWVQVTLHGAPAI